MALPRTTRRATSLAIAALLLPAGLVAVIATASTAWAANTSTTLFNQPFHDNTVDGSVGSVSVPSASGGNGACLSASGNTTTPPLKTCPDTPNAQGSGTLRFTNNTGSQQGGVFAAGGVSTTQGLDITFNSFQWNSTNNGTTTVGADGIAFVIAATDPANPVAPTSVGPSGASLGYSARSGLSGLSDAYLGIGLDTYGNFSNPTYQGSGCPTPPGGITGKTPGQVVVRGPGNGTVGYCALKSTAPTTGTATALPLSNTTRSNSQIPVEVVFNPTGTAITTSSGISVSAKSYEVKVTPLSGGAKYLTGLLPSVATGLYGATSWFNTDGTPKEVTFGWTSSTGTTVNYHEIDAAVASTLNVPVLAVSQAAYAQATTQGSSVTYQVAASATGTETLPVTVVETLPAGVVPGGAAGAGWVCAAPSGQTVSCTTPAGTFTSGTITVNAIASTAVSPSLLQTASAVATSNDAATGTSASATTGTLPAAPAVSGVSPTNGLAGSDTKLAGSNFGVATAVEIGTTAEFNAGTAATVSLCTTGNNTGCFTITGSTIDIASMPTHVGGSVIVRAVSLGAYGAMGSYTYLTSATISLSVSQNSVNFGTPVLLTATVTPAAATGTVTFTDGESSGPFSGQTKPLGTVTLSSGTATLNIALPAFNTNTITAVYSGDSTYNTATSNTKVVSVVAGRSQLLINQFRLSGPSGANDQYVELYNPGSAVPLAGFVVTASSGATFTLPSTAPTLPTGGTYLVTGGSYSLGVAADSSTSSLGTTGIQVTAPDASKTVVDAAGAVGALTNFLSGTGLPAFTGTPTDQYAWVRIESGGLPANTNNNATDFKLVSVNGGAVGGVTSTVGSPSPQDMATPLQDNGGLQSTLLDPAKVSSASPNFTYNSTTKLMTVSRTITNSGSATITKALCRITNLSETNGLPDPFTPSGHPSANLRFTDPATTTSSVTLTGGAAVTVQNISVNSPATSGAGGGLATTLTIPLSGGLAPGHSVNVAFTFAVVTGGTYWFGYDVDAGTG